MESFSILIIDDDKQFSDTIAKTLSVHDWTVDAADTAHGAVDFLRENAYDVVLLDVKLSGINGVETVNEIKKVQPETIVFMMSGEQGSELKNLPEQDVYAVIQKPLDMTSVIAMISNVEKKGVILVVDDNESDREKLSGILADKGYHVVTAKGGREAIEHTLKHDFDVVLLDLQLPDMEGSAVLEKIKEFKPALSIIAITGQDIDGIIDSLCRKGTYTCFLKPFDVEIMLREINTIMHRRTEERHIQDLYASKILVVEDNDTIRESTQLILSAEGYTVETASTLEEALSWIEKESFAIVISDLSLGAKSGLSLVEPVRKKDPTTVFLLMTGRASIETALEAIKKGIDEYILKPVEPPELIHKVQTYLEKQKITREKESLLKQLKETNVKLLELIKTDELTGVFNRRYLFEQLHHEVQRAKRQSTTLSLMMCDVDGFKRYNDTYGHVEGDTLLKAIAQALQSGVRQHVDQVFRYGGDEFAVLVPGADESGAKVIGERVVSRIRESLKEKRVGLSIGIAYFDGSDKNLSLNDLIHAADKKLYQAKKQGGNRVVS